MADYAVYMKPRYLGYTVEQLITSKAGHLTTVSPRKWNMRVTSAQAAATHLGVASCRTPIKDRRSWIFWKKSRASAGMRLPRGDSHEEEEEEEEAEALAG